MDAFNSALEQQKEDTLDITADMMRQYKAMQVCWIEGVTKRYCAARGGRAGGGRAWCASSRPCRWASAGALEAQTFVSRVGNAAQQQSRGQHDAAAPCLDFVARLRRCATHVRAGANDGAHP